MIPQKLLFNRGGNVRRYNKNQTVFFEGDMPVFYYQVVKGTVRMVNTNENGREFIQGLFSKGESFGEPAVLIDEPYPASGITNEESLIIKISKDEFINILKEFPDIHFQFTKMIAKTSYNKSLIAKAISINRPEQRLLSIFKILKDNYSIPVAKNYKVDFSRQQIADMIGFRVETVIRTIKRLEKKEMFKIQKGKIYL